MELPGLARRWVSFPLVCLAVIQREHMQKGGYDALAEVQRRKPWLTDKRPEP